MILQALAERTGTELGELRMTTIVGWVPWLADTLDPRDGQEAFDTYVRQDSVLLAPGEAGRSTVPRWLPWMPVRDKQWRTEPRACPACAAASGRGTSLLAALPIMTTCGEHGRAWNPRYPSGWPPLITTSCRPRRRPRPYPPWTGSATKA